MTIYDRPITVAKLPDDAGSIIQGPPEVVFRAYCGELEVYHRRYWDSVQAGSRIERLVELPFHRECDAGMYAKYKGQLYSIEQAQFGKDENGHPITTLSLKREEVPYDIASL